MLARTMIVLWLVLVPVPAGAAGFGLDFQGTRQLGFATAGGAAAEDATTIFYNAAGLTYLQRDQAVGGGQFFFLHDHFTDHGSTILNGVLPTPGGNGGDPVPLTGTPWLYGAHRLLDDVVVGIGLFAPFGLQTDYKSDFVGRYQNLLSSLKVVDVNPTAAWRPLSMLAVGGGLSVQYAEVELTQALDFGSACVAALGAPTCAMVFGLSPGRSDGRVRLTGNDFSYGFNVGVLFEPLQGSRIGLAYRSEIDHQFQGASQHFDVPENARAFLTSAGLSTAFTGSRAHTEVPLPARASLSLAQSLTDSLTLLADLTLTSWGVLQRTIITADNPVTGASTVIEQHFHDAYRYAAGVNYAPPNEDYELRAGLAYDETPIRLAFVQAALPDRDRVYVAFGGSYRIVPDVVLDVGVAHVQYVGSVPIDRTTANGDRLRGTFHAGGQIISAQIRVEF